MNFCTKGLTTRCHSLLFSKLSSACYQVPGRSTRYEVPGSTRLVPATRYQLPGCATNRMICRVCKAWGAAFLRICNCPSSQDLDLNSFLSQGLDFNLYVSLPLDLRCVVMHIFQLESVDIVDSVAPSGFAFLLIFVFTFSFAVVLPSGFFSLNLWILWIVWLPQELAKTLENSFFADDDQHESFTFCLFALQLFFFFSGPNTFTKTQKSK